MALLRRLTAWLVRPDRRAYRRHRGGGLHIELDGKPCKVVDWSLGGFRIGTDGRPLAVRQRVDGVISCRGTRGEFGAEIVTSGPREASARFLDITPRVLVAMSGLEER